MAPGAASCGTCGRRALPERIEPVLDPAATRARTGGAPSRKDHVTATHQPMAAPPLTPAHRSAAHPALRHLPNVLVGVGVVLAGAIYWSSSHDDASAKRAGAERVAKATGALRTSQPASPAQPQFSARQALQGLYGNYDPVLDGAYWTIAGAPKTLAGWNGKTVVIKPLISRSDETAARHVLVTHSVEVKNGMAVKQGTGCRHCRSLLGSALFERQGTEWKLVADHRFLGAEGVYGAPPTVAIAFPDTASVELRIDRAAADPLAVRELGSVVVLKGGNALKTTIAGSAAIEKREVAKRESEKREMAPAAPPFPGATEAP